MRAQRAAGWKRAKGGDKTEIMDGRPGTECKSQVSNRQFVTDKKNGNV